MLSAILLNKSYSIIRPQSKSTIPEQKICENDLTSSATTIAMTEGKWEKRWHPLKREWVVYAAHRNSRPWNTGLKDLSRKNAPEYDPGCYLCPGNPRVHGAVNPMYDGVYIFDNDHPVVGMQAPEIIDQADTSNGLYLRKPARGIARVVCYDKRHNTTLADVSVEQVANVFKAWRQQMKEFESNPAIHYVLIFENKGEICGVSNPHPHCQIYATDFVFKFIETEMEAAADFKKDFGKNIFEEIINREEKDKVRIVAENEGAIAFIPFFARWSYEAMIFPKNNHATLSTMSDLELDQLAAIFQEVTQRYDKLFSMSMPYVMTIHQAPVDGKDYPDYHLFIQILPPLRQPGLQKFPAGPEIGGGNFMSDTLPEEKAAELRAVQL